MLKRQIKHLPKIIRLPLKLPPNHSQLPDKLRVQEFCLLRHRFFLFLGHVAGAGVDVADLCAVGVPGFADG